MADGITDARNSRIGWILLRLTLAGLIAAHGWARFVVGGYEPFGAWLTAQGIPMGPAVAWAITLLEMAGTPLLAWGRLFVLPLTLVYAAIYTVGIYLVHAPAGWFVVGLGRNGAEYSVLLIVALLCVGLQHLPERTNRG
ncbi:MAG: DoxX family protein [Pseudomonadota bacterium]